MKFSAEMCTEQIKDDSLFLMLVKLDDESDGNGFFVHHQLTVLMRRVIPMVGISAEIPFHF